MLTPENTQPTNRTKNNGLAKRIIPCLDVRQGQVVKGVQFRNHQIVGEILELAKYYRDEGADELVFYDITASTQDRALDLQWVEKVSASLDIPFCVAGGITSIEQAQARLAAGADKISINSPALMRPELINELSDAFGRQCIVIGIDSFCDTQGIYRVKSHTGSESAMKDTGRLTHEWAQEVAARGAGEIVLNCMNQDGVRKGYDIAHLTKIRHTLSQPLIASGGAGTQQHFNEVFTQANVDGALAASVFHKSIIRIPHLKQYLHNNNIPIRL